MSCDASFRPFDALPPPALRFGGVDANTVAVGFDGSGTQLDAVAAVPVKLGAQTAAPRRYVMFRFDAPGDTSPPRAEDVPKYIDCQPAADGTPAFRRALWEGCDGALVLLLDGTGRVQEREHGGRRVAVHEAIAAALARDAVDLEAAFVSTDTVEGLPVLFAPGADADVSRPVPAAQAPAPAPPTALCVAVASCQYPAGLVDGTPVAAATPGPADASYHRLLERWRAPRGGRPQLVVLTGDQIYSDATAGLFDPLSAADRYDAPHRRLFDSRYFAALSRSLPLAMMLDDHELEDGFENEGDWLSRQVLQAGRRAYTLHQRSTGPLPRVAAARPRRLFCTLPLRGFEFFFADTRTERAKRTARSVASAAIMSKLQMGELLAWLAKGHGEQDVGQRPRRPRFVVSPSAVLPRRLSSRESAAAALRSDGWDGYPASLHRLLGWIARHHVDDVVFLSGDHHVCSLTTATTTTARGALRLYCIHASALYAPYPFANARAEDFAERDEIEAGGQRWYVESRFAQPGQGFAVLRLEPLGAGWRLHVEFDLDSGIDRPPAIDFG